MKNKHQWSVESLDIVLGLVGGFAGICWSTLSYMLADYQDFRYENSLIGSIFPTSPSEAEHVPSGESEAVQQMIGTVAGRGKYFYSFAEYCWSQILRFLFCCCK